LSEQRDRLILSTFSPFLRRCFTFPPHAHFFSFCRKERRTKKMLKLIFILFKAPKEHIFLAL
jgi:hypothetical protein